MMPFRKISAASEGHLIRKYFAENTPEPIHDPALAPGRRLEPGERLTAYYTGRDSRATWRPDMPLAAAQALGIDPTRMPRDKEMDRLFEGKRADTGEAWSKHERKISAYDFTFSPHKSVTLAAESAAIWNAIDRANDDATLVHTDEYGIYAHLPAWGYGHKTVCHARGKYARDEDGDGFCEVHVNTLEGFWSLPRSWLRPHRGISQDKLPLYLGFFQFVHNARRRGKALLSALNAGLVA